MPPLTPRPDGASQHIDLARGWTAAQVRAAEQPLLDAGEPLMARAAAGLADELRHVLAAREKPWRLLVLVGSGNNGGDALFAAAEIAAEGAIVLVAPLGGHPNEEGLAAAVEAGAAVLEASEATPEQITRIAAASDVILDGILGTGAAASPALRSPAREVVAALLPALAARTASGPAVVAVDLPSGVSADDGSAPGPVLPATVTVTFGAMKIGLLRPPASQLAGRIRLIDIGLGATLPI